jgi:hypothetical protein
MIPKGSQRAGGQQLATHLLNEFDNDRVEVAEVRGAIAPDLHGAFAEWSATASGTKCHKYLYSLSVNPDPDQGPLTREQYRDFIDRAEKKLGLTGQPRALVFHVKHGREHCHAVWSRIDIDKMRAVQLSHDRHALRAVVIEFARDHGLNLPRGVTADRSRERRPRRRAENLAEKQQEERTGMTREERMRAITDAWHDTRDARNLVTALETRGFLLARGDRRAYVVVDRFGEIHSLSRQISGVRAKDVKARLADYPLENLPDAKKAQAFARQQRETVKDKLPAAKENAQERRATLAASHAQRRALVEQRALALARQHKAERDALTDAQRERSRGVISARLRAQPKGMMAFLTRITGIDFLVGVRRRAQDRHREQEHRRQSEALERRHQRERQDFARHTRALDKIETRERRSLETALRREEFARIAKGPEPPPRSPAHDRRAPDGSDRLSDAFNERADPDATQRTPPDQRKEKSKEHDMDAGLSLGDDFDAALRARAARQRKEQERDQGKRRGPDRDNGR